jgi:hypothetical protein
VIRSSWLTATRTRRLLDVLAAVPAHGPGLPGDAVPLTIWRACGGPIDEIPHLVEVLVGAELLVQGPTHLRLHRTGQRVLGRRPVEGIRPLGLALLRAGYFHDQARRLLDLGVTDDDGSLTCPLREARRACPQLVGLLEHWTEVVGTRTLQVPAGLMVELQAVWALLPPPAGDGTDDSIRKSIGDRGELYTYQLERLEAVVSSDIVWVARDDPNLGYDVEDRSTEPRRRIEVKASGDTTVRFFLSDNEWRKSHDGTPGYEIQFWGGVDLAAQPAEEFARLRANGYPLVFTDLPDLIDAGQLEAVPTKWRITQPTRSAHTER